MRLIALDLVRFYAALSVVIYHYTADTFENLSVVTQYGYLGVPMFFIISGYVIALSANNRTAFEFAVSRFTRLYPAYWASIAFTVLVIILLTDHTFSLTQILANLTMVNDYFKIKNIDNVYWTLQKELQFYACVFLLVFFRAFSKIRIWLSIWIILTIVFLLVGQPFFMGWFISPEYSSFFIAGVAFYLIRKEGVSNYSIGILIISLIISSIYGLGNTVYFMTEPSVPEKLIAIILILFFYLFFYALVTNKITVKKSNLYLTLGAITYPLYLIHNVAGKTIINELLKFMPEWTAVIITITSMILFSYLIHIVVEKRISGRLKSKLLQIKPNEFKL